PPGIAARRLTWTKVTRATWSRCCVGNCARPPAGSVTACASSSWCWPSWPFRRRFVSLTLPFRPLSFCSFRVAKRPRRSGPRLSRASPSCWRSSRRSAVFMLSLSEAALGIPLMGVMTFGAMFLSRASPLGPVFFVAGFIIAYGLTLGDEVLGLALQPATAGNVPQFELPEIAFGPPEEALVRFLLWLSLAIVVPVVLVIAANLLTGRDPALLLRRALAERLAASARFCAGEREAERALEAQAFEGTAGLRKLSDLAGLLHRGRGRPGLSASLIDDIARLGLLLLAWLRVEDDRNPLVPAAGACRQAERGLEDGEPPSPEPVAITATGAARPLADAISRRLRAVQEALAGTPLGQKSHDAAEAPHRLLAPDAFTNVDYVRFALKVTLAVMICYFVMSMTNWPGIHTCIITAFVVALGTVG